MNPRAYLLVALLVSPAWSQEPVADPPMVTASFTARSFDLSNDSIRKIVRDGAATQFASVRASNDTPVEPERVAVRFVPVEKALPAPKPRPPRLQPAPPSGGFISALVDILLDSDDDEAAVYSQKCLRCELREPMTSTSMGDDTCPDKVKDRLLPPP